MLKRALLAILLLFCATLLASPEEEHSSALFRQSGLTGQTEIVFQFGAGPILELAEYRGLTLAAAWHLSEPNAESYYRLAVLDRRIILTPNSTTFVFNCLDEYAEKVASRFASQLTAIRSSALDLSSFPEQLPGFFEFPMQALASDFGNNALFNYPPDSIAVRALKYAPLADFISKYMSSQNLAIWYRSAFRRPPLEKILDSLNSSGLAATTLVEFSASRLLQSDVESNVSVKTGSRWTMEVSGGSVPGLLYAYFAFQTMEQENNTVFFALGNRIFATTTGFETAPPSARHDASLNSDIRFMKAQRMYKGMNEQVLRGLLPLDPSLASLFSRLQPAVNPFDESVFAALEGEGTDIFRNQTSPDEFAHEQLGKNVGLFVAKALNRESRIHLYLSGWYDDDALSGAWTAASLSSGSAMYDTDVLSSLSSAAGMSFVPSDIAGIYLDTFPPMCCVTVSFKAGCEGMVLRWIASWINKPSRLRNIAASSGSITNAMYSSFLEKPLSASREIRIFSSVNVVLYSGGSDRILLPSVNYEEILQPEIPLAVAGEDDAEIFEFERHGVIAWSRADYFANASACAAVLHSLKAVIGKSYPKAECDARAYRTNWGNLVCISVFPKQDDDYLAPAELKRVVDGYFQSDISDMELLETNDRFASWLNSCSSNGALQSALSLMQSSDTPRILLATPRLDRFQILAARKALLGSGFHCFGLVKPLTADE